MSMSSSDYLNEVRWRAIYAQDKAEQAQYEIALNLVQQMNEYLLKAERALKREIKYKRAANRIGSY